MKIITIIGLLVTLTGFSQINEIDLKIPNKVEIKKNSNSEQLPGTRVFMTKPPGYQLISSLIRFQKDENTYIQVIESPQINFEERKSEIKKAFKKVEESGLKLYYKKDFKLGDYNAIIVYAPDKRPNMDEITLIFGDTDFVVVVAGDFPAGNEKARKQILSAMLTTYLNKSVKADPTILAKYSIDLSKSKFKYNSFMSQLYYYTIDGLGEPMSDPSVTSFFIMTLPAANNFEERKAYAQSMIDRYKTNGISIPSFEEKEILINNEKAYEISFTGSITDKPVKVYQVILGDSKATLLFLGMASNDFDAMDKEFRNVAQTLKTK